MTVPKNLQEWLAKYVDDWGFEAFEVPKPTTAAPGSWEKVVELTERLARGQMLWHPQDPVKHWGDASQHVDYRTKGSTSYGAMVGKDSGGCDHRYGIWKAIKENEHRPRNRILYVTELASFDDSFVSDPELAAIYRHAKGVNATMAIVTSLFTKRVRRDRELISEDGYAITEASNLFLRWCASKADKVILCFGDSQTCVRVCDVMWVLRRTMPGGKLYSTDQEARLPPFITRYTPPSFYRYEIPPDLDIQEAKNAEKEAMIDQALNQYAFDTPFVAAAEGEADRAEHLISE